MEGEGRKGEGSTQKVPDGSICKFKKEQFCQNIERQRNDFIFKKIVFFILDSYYVEGKC